MPISGLLTRTVAPAGALPKTQPKKISLADTVAAHKAPTTPTAAIARARAAKRRCVRIAEHAFMGIPAFHRRGEPMSGQGFGVTLMRVWTVACHAWLIAWNRHRPRPSDR